MNTAITQSYRQMIAAAVLAIVLGFIMLFYPGGTMALISVAFWALRLLISVFILTYTVSEAIRYFRAEIKTTGALYLIIGVLATTLVWVFDVSIVYMVVSFFFVLAGISEIFGAFHFTIGRYFLIFLGLVSILIGAIMLKNPVILPMLIAWYVLFWGVSRFFLALEIKRTVP